MSRLVASFDPSTGSGTFQASAVNKCSTLWIMNESPNFITLDFGGASTPKLIQPWYNKKLTLANPVQQVTWTVPQSLQSGGAPASIVYVELYESSEDVSDLISGPLSRQTNVGNAVTTGAVTTIQNDGNPANTTIVEGTPSGAASSQALITNDGRAILGGGTVTISNAGVFATPAGAIPGASVGGAVSEAQSLNNQVTSSDNGTGQLYSTVNGRGVALGYKDSGGTYHEVLTINTDGSVSLANGLTLGGAIQQAGDTLAIGGTGGQSTVWQWYGPASLVEHITPNAGGANGHLFGTWNGSASLNPFGVGSAAGGYAPSHVDDNGNLYAASLNGTVTPPNGGALAGINKISGSGSATVNHGLSVVPDAAVVNTANGSNSTTFGSGSYTSTTVYIYQYNPQPWVGVVYKA